MTTQWAKFRDFINSKEIGYVFTRKELGNLLKIKTTDEWYNPGQGTADCYRSLLQQAKFLSNAGRGKYKLEEHIPEGLTMGALNALLRGDNLTYIESIQHQKDFKIVKEKFLKERAEVLTILVQEVFKLIPLASTIEPGAFGLKGLLREMGWQKNKTPNPTKEWLKRQPTTVEE